MEPLGMSREELSSLANGVSNARKIVRAVIRDLETMELEGKEMRFITPDFDPTSKKENIRGLLGLLRGRIAPYINEPLVKKEVDELTDALRYFNRLYNRLEREYWGRPRRY